jgi:hypothetical protein
MALSTLYCITHFSKLTEISDKDNSFCKLFLRSSLVSSYSHTQINGWGAEQTYQDVIPCVNQLANAETQAVMCESVLNLSQKWIQLKGCCHNNMRRMFLRI